MYPRLINPEDLIPPLHPQATPDRCPRVVSGEHAWVVANEDIGRFCRRCGIIDDTYELTLQDKERQAAEIQRSRERAEEAIQKIGKELGEFDRVFIREILTGTAIALAIIALVVFVVFSFA